MIDESRLTPKERELWDEFFPGGSWAGAPHREGPVLRLWTFGYYCMLVSGPTPEPVAEVLREHSNLGADIREYIDRRTEAERNEAGQ